MHREWTLWKPRALKHVARLEKQIEFLAEKLYSGCGYHSALLPDLQETKRQITELEAGSEWTDGCIAMVRLGCITKIIKKAVQDAKGRMQ